MKAPDKIYLGIDDIESGYVYNLSLDNNGHPEYIRKDALMEWANREDVEILKKIPSDGNVWSNGYLCGMKDLIDKLNSL